MKVMVIQIVIGTFEKNEQRMGRGTGGLGNRRTREKHPNYSIIEIPLNSKKSTGDLRRLAVNQTLEKLV